MVYLLIFVAVLGFFLLWSTSYYVGEQVERSRSKQKEIAWFDEKWNLSKRAVEAERKLAVEVKDNQQLRADLGDLQIAHEARMAEEKKHTDSLQEQNAELEARLEAVREALKDPNEAPF